MILYAKFLAELRVKDSGGAYYNSVSLKYTTIELTRLKETFKFRI